jgi:hypothetical protein
MVVEPLEDQLGQRPATEPAIAQDRELLGAGEVEFELLFCHAIDPP